MINLFYNWINNHKPNWRKSQQMRLNALLNQQVQKFQQTETERLPTLSYSYLIIFKIECKLSNGALDIKKLI